MRKNGMALLQSFTDGPVMFAPECVGELRVLAEAYAENGMVSTMIQSVASGLGLAPSRAREDLSTAILDQRCEALGLNKPDREKPFAFVDGMAIIPITGSLLHRDNYSDSYATGYDYIANKYTAAMLDPDVKGIVFDVNSPGGHVRGCFELCDTIFAGRAIKPTLALVDGSAYSAAYALASSATHISVIQSAGVGSIGVVAMHASVEQLLDKHGIDINFIYAGDHKVDGNPFKALPDDVRARFQASVDKSYEKFVSMVARNRGVGADAVRATQAACFDADEALSLGLIDAIHSPLRALVAFRQELEGFDTTVNTGVMNMSVTNPAAGGDNTNVAAPAAAPAVADAPAVVATPAAADPAVDTPVVETSAADVRTQERERVKAITTSAEATGREALASHLACNTDMSAEDAIKTLAATPAVATVAAAPGTTPFAAAMDSTVNPNVGTSGGGDEDDEVVVTPMGAQIAESWSKMTGNPLRKTN